MYEIIGDTSAFSDVETLDALQALILKKNNPSVSCADSSLYTREPWFAVSRKLKQCIINALRVDSVFRCNEAIEKITADVRKVSV